MISEPLPGSLRAQKASVAEHRPLPAAMDAERGVISSVLMQPACLDDLGSITRDHFHHPAHGTIWQVMLDLYTDRLPIDLVTVTQALADRNLLEQIGGPAVLANLQTFLPTAANVAYYSDIMKEKALLRAIIKVGTETVRMAYDHQGLSPDNLLNEVEASWLSLRQGTRAESSLRPMQEVVMEAIDGIEALYKNKGKCLGVETGIIDFDRMTGGLKPGQLVIIAGRPGMGKSALSMQMATHAAGKGTKVAVFSLEMTGREICERMICSDMSLDLPAMRNGFLSKEAFRMLPNTADKLARLGLWIDETPALNIFELRGRARRAVTKYCAGLIVVDYLQLMRSTSRRAQENRANEVAEISMALKATAKELEVPVIAAAQLSRSAEERSTPKLSDLRESGQIEQDADIVCIVHRPKKGMKDRETGEELEDGTVEFIVAKHRNGAVNTVHLHFESKYTRFENMTEEMFSNNAAKRQRNFHSKPKKHDASFDHPAPPED